MGIHITQEPTKLWKGAWLTRLIQKTTALLKELQTTPGVQGAFVFDNQGRPLGVLVDGPPDHGTLERTGIAIAQLFTALEKPTPKEIEIRFERSLVFVRDLGNAFQAVQCTPSANRAMLRMAINVAAAPFERDTELQSELHAAATRTVTLTDSYLDAQALEWVRQMRSADGESSSRGGA